MKLHCIEVKFLGKYNYYHLGCLSNLNRYFKIKDVSNIYETKKNTYYFGLQYAIFDNLTKKGINYLDDIFNDLKKQKKEYLKKKLSAAEYEYENFKTKYDEDEIKQFKKKIENIEKDFYISKKEWENYKNSKIYNYSPDGDFEYKNKIDIPIFNFGKVNSRTTDMTFGKTTIYVNDGLGDDISVDEKEYKKKPLKKWKKIYKVNFPKSKDELKNLYTHLKIMYLKRETDNYIESIKKYEVIIDNEIKLIHAFLDMIFEFEAPLNLRKCELCGKYFIRQSGGQKRCTRFYKDGKTCMEYIENSKNKYENLSDIKRLENNVKAFTNSARHDDYERYIDNHKKMKEELSEKEYVSWLLTFYVDDERRKKAIERYNLQQYIN